ncbi:spondin domain-containing protein [Algibacillus agarilyticus]|uniref:spondin domain-containing protein n=1 Tax=Algibacillus agarilyticus TaxID=2234133 RepID=UPI000DD035DE|nr:spondin domain-containing protein [Algibacillus agarilyticus]
MFNFKRTASIIALASVALIAGCSDDDDNNTPEMMDMDYRYQVTVSNLTHAQPLSPIAAILHEDGMLWQIGQPASAALEQQAESGDNSQLLAGYPYSASGSGVVMPGVDGVVEVSIKNNANALLTVSSMLVNTNDAFVGLNAIALADLMVGESMTMMGHVYDAGTEANNELANSIPGPAAGGAGFDATRDDVNFVAMHPGVVSQDDGLASSVLTQAHRFDNPSVKFTIVRMQ